jgi:ribosomal protein L40E
MKNTATSPALPRYCEMCDAWVPARQTECKQCGAPTIRSQPPKKE